MNGSAPIVFNTSHRIFMGERHPGVHYIFNVEEIDSYSHNTLVQQVTGVPIPAREG
jgi:hypothetical protein